MSSAQEAEVLDAELRLQKAMLASDVPVLDELLSPELVFTNHLGQRVDKAADLSAHRSGQLQIARLDCSEQQCVVAAEGAVVVSVRAKIEGTYAGEPAGGDFRFTRVWAKSHAGDWSVVAAHAGLIAEVRA